MKLFILCTLMLFLFLICISPAMADYKLTMNFSGMDPHIGQMLEIRVVDKGNGLEVGRTNLASIPGATFSVELYVLIPDSSYSIEFYADFNNNSQYDAPPTDHAWTAEIDNVVGDTQVNFTHNMDFTDIAFPAPIPIAHLVGDWDGRWENPTFEVSGAAAGTFTANTENNTAVAQGQAWGIFGNPEPVSYTLNGTIGPDPWTAVFTAQDPWSGTITLSNGQITGTIGYSSIGISAAVLGNYGLGQMIIYYLMTGSFTAEELTLMFRDNIVIPVELASFSGTFNTERYRVNLEWQTATETNNYGFEIERATSKKNNEWQKIGFVKGKGTTSTPHNYFFTDELTESGVPAKQEEYSLSYRLRQIDHDGTFTYSQPVEVTIQSAPLTFKLLQNYPNPFNPVTIISFELQEKSNIRLVLTNILGKVVKEIAEGEYEAGYHKILFNAQDLAAGLYVYKLEANGFTDMKKLVVIK